MGDTVYQFDGQELTGRMSISGDGQVCFAYAHLNFESAQLFPCEPHHRRLQVLGWFGRGLQHHIRPAKCDPMPQIGSSHELGQHCFLAVVPGMGLSAQPFNLP